MTDTDGNFAAFLAERQRPLLRIATALTGDPQLADEIVSDALSRAWEQWDRICIMDHPNAYVRKMVVNEFLSWRRRRRRTHPVAEIATFADYADAGSDHASRHAERSSLISRLGSLPRKQRAALILRYVEDLSDEQIAELLGCAPVTVRTNISRALSTLRIEMNTTGTGGGASLARPAPIIAVADGRDPNIRHLHFSLKGEI